MAIFLVQLPDESGQTLADGVTAYVIEADSAAEARELAAAQAGADQNWNDSSVTAVDVTTLSAANMLGWRYVITISDPGVSRDDAVIVQVEHIGLSGDADADAMAADLVTALNAHPLIAAAAYSTPNLTVAETTDALGDKALSVDVYPPGAKETMPAMVGAITDEGSAGAALAVALVVPTAIPEVIKSIK